MMRKKITALSILLLLPLTSVFAQREWPTFKSTEENFTISLPSEPKQEWTASRSPLGNGHHIYSLERDGVSFTISNSVIENPPTQPKDIKRVLDFTRDLVVVVTNGKLLTDTDISIVGVDALARMQNSNATKLIHGLARSDNVQTRRRTVQSLSLNKDPASIDLLIESLTDTVSVVRESAADSLRRSTGKDFGQDAGKWKEWWAINKPK